jgi:DNA-directed RNA polymerase subunit M/transcription elongation factor TFIIS
MTYLGCPKCGSDEYSTWNTPVGVGDPSDQYCVCDCGHEFQPEEAQEFEAD